MSKQTKLIIVAGVLLILCAGAAYVYFADNSHAADAADFKNLEAVQQATEQAAKTAPPPVKFNDLPAEPSTGRRIPTQ